MLSQPDQRRGTRLRTTVPTRLRWIGVGEQTVEGIQSVTVDPDSDFASEGAPEWLVTNGLGGYASGTMTGLVTRRFHGYLVAALPAPRGRTMMLNHLRTIISTDQGRARLTEQPDPEGIGEPLALLREFRFELGLPVWTFEHQGNLIEARIIMPHRQNTVFITCERLSGTGKLQLSFDPWIQFRPHEGSLSGLVDNQYALRASAGRYEIEDLLDVGLPPLRMKVVGADAKFEIDERRICNVKYLILRTFAKYLKDGLIPNMFPEGKGEGLYHTADATLWFFHAAKRYVEVSGEDDAIRPNQLFAISLPHPVLDPGRWKAVVDIVHDRLLTPYGLRSLAPGHPAYQPLYFGDLRARDLAYHQGTVWPWLIGPFVDAWRRVYPDRIEELRPIAESLGQHMASACIGSISEIFDAEPPYTPRGCCAQAWSIAEILRLMTVIDTSMRIDRKRE